MEEDFPKKQFYTIGEVSHPTGVRPHVLRYWEGQGQKFETWFYWAKGKSFTFMEGKKVSQGAFPPKKKAGSSSSSKSSASGMRKN
ncbi:MAG: MerR family transcriptional regulator [Acidobacteriia bacterium]|nr:MerR family transcriptional regulator [Terriglobia bacterium]